MDLFKIVPANFFNVFAGESRRQYADVLFIIYDIMSGTSFMASRDSIMIALTEYFEQLEGDTFDTVTAKTAKDKASACLRRLKECGWIKEETGRHYETSILFEDYATVMLDAMRAMEKTESVEYGGYVHTIHTLVTSLKDDTADLTIEQIHQNTVKLMHSLKALNANIKKYIERLIKRKDDDDIEALLETLLIDYQDKVVNRAYQNLKTIDNPSRFKNTIINRLDGLLHNTALLTQYSQLYGKRKEVDEETAYQTLYDMLSDVIHAFDLLDDVMAEIEYKHSRYLNVAVARITYLYQNKGDLEGKVHRLIHRLAKQDTATFTSDANLFNLEALINLDGQSLYKQPLKNTFTTSKIAPSAHVNRAAIEAEAALLMRESQFSLSAINAYVKKMCGDDASIMASALPLETTLDYILMILITLYAYDDAAKYTIETKPNTVHKAGRTFNDFIIWKGERNEPLQ